MLPALSLPQFRTDRIVSLTVTDERYGKRRAVLEREWRDGWMHEAVSRESAGEASTS